MSLKRIVLALPALCLISCAAPPPPKEVSKDYRPSSEELRRYHRAVGLPVEANADINRVPALNVAVAKDTNREKLYFTVTVHAVDEFPWGIVDPLPRSIFAHITDAERKAAHSAADSRSNPKAILNLAKKVLGSSACVGRQVTASDIKLGRVTDPDDLAKIIAASNGNIFDVNVNDLHISGKPVPIVDFAHLGPGTRVRLKCS